MPKAVSGLSRKCPIFNCLRFKQMARTCCNLWSLVGPGGSRQLHFYLQQELLARGQRARITGIIIDMGMVRISEAELARDLHAVLAKVQQGIEVVVEQDHRPVAVIKPSQPAGRMISEVVSDLKTRGSTAVIDDDFPIDIEEGIQAHRQPWHPPARD